VVDTNVLSELSKRVPNPGVLRWASQVQEIGISAITLEEVYYGCSAEKQLGNDEGA
jgi:predicted nucleic acid-binding protein